MAFQDLNPLRRARSVCSEFLCFPTDSAFIQVMMTPGHYFQGPLNAAPSIDKGTVADVHLWVWQCCISNVWGKGWKLRLCLWPAVCCIQCYYYSLCLKLLQTLSMRPSHTVSLLNSIPDSEWICYFSVLLSYSFSSLGCLKYVCVPK